MWGIDMKGNYEKYSDAELVQCYQKGDEEAGNALYQRYWSPLCRFFRKKVKGNRREDIEDLVQETFCETLKTLKNLRSPASFQPWIYKIARRVIRNRINVQQKRIEYVSLDHSPEDELEQTFDIESFHAPVTEQPEYQTLDNELRDICLRFEQTLRPDELRVFRLRHHKGKTFQEIGEALAIKQGTAKVRYHRVVQAFRAWLGKHYPDIYHSNQLTN